MKNCWFQVILVLSAMAFATAGDSQNTTQARTLLSLTYQYRIDLNVSQVFPTIDAVMDRLSNDTLETIGMLQEEDSDDPLFLIDNLDSQIQASCTTTSSSEACILAESTATVSLRSNVDERLLEFAALDEVQRFLRIFTDYHTNVTVSFVGPLVVRTDVKILLEGVIGRMTTSETQVFEAAFVDTFGPMLLNAQPPTVLKSATVFLQQVMEKRRRLQTDGNTDDEGVLVSAHVTGQCNRCSNNDFARVFGDAIDIGRPGFQQNLQDDTRTDFFDNVSVQNAPTEEAPGISECCLDFYPPSDPVPYWVFIVVCACIVIFTIALCCAAFRGGRSKGDKLLGSKNAMHHIGHTKTEEASEASAVPHVRKSKRDRRASSLTF